MKKSIKLAGCLLVPLIGVSVVAAHLYFAPIFAVGTGYAAKILCSSRYVSGRSYDTIKKEDLNLPGLAQITSRLDEKNNLAEASVLGIYKSRAIFRPGLGCTLCTGDSDETRLRRQALGMTGEKPVLPKAFWPDGQAVSDDLPPGINAEGLKTALDSAFDETAEHLRRTRAVVVVYDGRIVAERYAPGISKDTPLLGWSMTKSITNALVGILVKQKKLDPKQTALMPQWQKENDPRRHITLDQLMRMSSGLKFTEVYSGDITSDVNLMLLTKFSASEYAANKPLEADPGTKWYYSSGTTNIIARIARDASGLNQLEWFNFPGKELFDKIGMTSAVLEPDPSGNFVGSSYMYATARDWARFGLLYLRDGVWNGERILPEGWVTYTTTPTPHTKPGEGYGAQFWLNFPNPERRFSFLPDDAFMALGHECQAVIIIPSRNIVVVRLGLYRGPHVDAQLGFVEKILQSITSPQQTAQE